MDKRGKEKKMNEDEARPALALVEWEVAQSGMEVEMAGELG